MRPYGSLAWGSALAPSSINFSIDALCQHRIKVWGLVMPGVGNEQQQRRPATQPEPVRGRGYVGGLNALLTALLPVTRAIDATTAWIGKRLAWLILAAVIVSALNATVRKVF